MDSETAALVITRALRAHAHKQQFNRLKLAVKAAVSPVGKRERERERQTERERERQRERQRETERENALKGVCVCVGMWFD